MECRYLDRYQLHNHFAFKSFHQGIAVANADRAARQNPEIVKYFLCRFEWIFFQPPLSQVGRSYEVQPFGEIRKNSGR